MPTSTEELLRHVYGPKGAAVELFNSRAPELLISGPAGTGKSRAALEKLHMMMLLNPGARGLIVRKTLVSLTSTGLVTWREHVVPEALRTGEVVWYGGSMSEPAAYQYRNGSTVVVGGMDKSTKIMSSEYDVIFVQEATELTENDWEALTTRLRNGRIRFQQLIADCNPSTPTHWLKVRANAGRTLMLESRHEDNPVLFDDTGAATDQGRDYMAKLDALSGVRYLRLRRGIWAAAEGLVYEEWDPAVHLIERFKIPEEWTRYWSIDFGYTNPFVCQWWAEDPDGRLYLYRELYRTQRLVADHAKDILWNVTRRDGSWREPHPRAIICDHDAEGRATLERELGLGTTAAHKSVTDGIQAVQRRIRVAEDGKPRIFVFRDAAVERDQALADAGKPTCTSEEIVGYIWDNAEGKPPKEVPLKQDDHGADAMRYIVAKMDLKGVTRVRWI